MLVQDARAVARQWIAEQGGSLPGFHSAYLAGSTNWLPPDAPFPATSDVDINIVFKEPGTSHVRHKFVYRDVLLEITPLSLEQFQSVDDILGDYHLAGGLSTPSVISDPSGRLTEIQSAVSSAFHEARWVRRRCEHARQRVLSGLSEVDQSASLHDQVIAWLFSTGVTTHVLLVTGLQNPTVRSRYVAVRRLLDQYGYQEFHETLLEMAGYANLTKWQVERHLAALTQVFDVARAMMRTPFAFSSDITDLARPLAIDGSRELIGQGYHREAMFWIAVTYSRCRIVLAADAPVELQERFNSSYQEMLCDLGIGSSTDLRARREQVRSRLPSVWDMAEAIMDSNPGIVR